VEHFGEFLLLFNDGVVCCSLLLFIASLSVELVFLSFFFYLTDVYCFMLYYMMLKFSLAYLPVLILFVLLILIS